MTQWSAEKVIEFMRRYPNESNKVLADDFSMQLYEPAQLARSIGIQKSKSSITSPHALIDELRKTEGIPTDTQLAKELCMHPSQISNIRNRKLPVSANLILKIVDHYGWPLDRVNELIDQANKEISA